MKEQINDYLHYLNIERGLSANTRQSYERDLEQYLHFLQEQKIASWQDVDRFLVIRFLEKLHEEKKATATVTRMISSLRRFHQFLRQERITDHDQFNLLLVFIIFVNDFYLFFSLLFSKGLRFLHMHKKSLLNSIPFFQMSKEYQKDRLLPYQTLPIRHFPLHNPKG